MTGPDVTGTEEYAEKAAREAVGESEARALALQGIVELSRGVDIAVAEIRAGRFMQAGETLMLAKAGCVVAEAAIQRIRVEAARVEERERIAQEIEANRSTRWQTHLAAHPYSDARSCPADYAAHDALYAAARIARGEATR